MTTVSNSCNPVSRRLTLGLAAALLAVPALFGSAQAASMDEIKSRGLIVATEDDFRPFEFVKDGKATGFDNEMIEDLRKYAPFEIKQQILPWTGILAGVSTGKALIGCQESRVPFTPVMVSRIRFHKIGTDPE